MGNMSLKRIFNSMLYLRAKINTDARYTTQKIVFETLIHAPFALARIYYSYLAIPDASVFNIVSGFYISLYRDGKFECVAVENNTTRGIPVHVGDYQLDCI